MKPAHKPMPQSRVLDKGIWGMSRPMFLDQAVTYTIPLIDMYFLSRISDSAAAAVGAITPLVFVANAFLIVSAFAGASIASQRIGANDYLRGNATIAAYAIFVVVLALIAALAVNHGGPWVATAMSLSGEVEQHARTYLSIIGWMVALWGCRVIYQTILNIYGEPQWNTYSNIILFGVNIIGNAIAVYGFMGIPPSGVVGVAIASIIAAGASLLFVVVIVHFKLRIHIPLHEGWKNFSVLMAPVLMIAAPSVLEPMSFQAYMIALNWIAAEVGDLALKVKVYAYNTFLFCLMISIALGMATEAIIAQRVGRKEFDLVDKQLKQSLKIALIGTTTLALMWLVFNQSILKMFSNDPEVIAIGVWAFVLSFLAEPWRTVNIVVGGALRCAGDATFTSVSSIAVIWLFSVPLAYALAIPLGFGLYGLLIAAILDELLRALIKGWRWKQGKWMHTGIAAREARAADFR
ncbi:MATE family efflux transporter [Cellvibrio sp. QJXJ]|uniref:MATE family efflux transporter n=1 Tax=Cellvibrio sp. QJXJ TaxID=2964606 RepID=UPI0021C33BE8|nr:MATE family efflux transporter [Cellvibrio sp. QJXJ]UUA73035.1 MATE family efflux transporter [Cellvibrio sp. QJXJ]